MRPEGISPKVSIKPWIFLFSLSLHVSFPFTSFGQSCTKPEISYIVKDEFGVETSVPRVGGTLEITCTKYGTPKPVIFNGATEVDQDVKYKGHGKFEIKINSRFAELRCACGNEKSLKSTDRIGVENVLCNPKDAVCPDSAELCWLQTDGTGKCGGSRKSCVEGGAKETPPGYTLHVFVKSTAGMEAKKSCEALLEGNNEKWGQVELKSSPELVKHPLLAAISKG